MDSIKFNGAKQVSVEIPAETEYLNRSHSDRGGVCRDQIDCSRYGWNAAGQLAPVAAGAVPGGS